MIQGSKGEALCKQREGLRLKAYLCQAGVPTIGWGTTRGVTLDDVHAGRTITRQEADIMFRNEWAVLTAQVLALCTATTSDNELGAMTCLAYNIGMGWAGKKKPAGAKDGFRQSSVLRLHNAGKNVEAAAAFERWNQITDPHTGQLVESNGLTSRRKAEAALYLEADAIMPKLPMPQSVEPPRAATPVAVPVTSALTIAGGSGVALAIVEPASSVKVVEHVDIDIAGYAFYLVVGGAILAAVCMAAYYALRGRSK